jgi:octopine/nopaline transport system substrate-binding protein
MTPTKALAVALLCLVWSGTGCSQQPMSIRVATEGAYAPWNFVNSRGQLDGFEVELTKVICARAKLRCDIVTQNWDGIVPSLLTGKYDAIVAAMQITDKRLETLAFTRPYASGVHGLMTLSSSPLAKLAKSTWHLEQNKAESATAIEALRQALKGKVVGVQVATSNARFADEYLKGIAEVREYKTTEQHDLDLAAGRVDAVFGGYPASLATIATPLGKNMVLAGPGFRGGLLGRGAAIALRKDDKQLRETLDRAVAEVIADETVKRLSLKWFKFDVTPQP